MRPFRAIAISLLALCGTAALALPNFVSPFQNAYKAPRGSALAKAACISCHKTAAGIGLNPYGLDLKKALAGNKVLNKAVLKKIERKDSDKDGKSNLAELKKGTLPGDKKSK